MNEWMKISKFHPETVGSTLRNLESKKKSQTFPARWEVHPRAKSTDTSSVSPSRVCLASHPGTAGVISLSPKPGGA